MPDLSLTKPSLLITHPTLILPVKQLDQDPYSLAAAMPPVPKIDLDIPKESFGGAKITLEIPVVYNRTKNTYMFDTSLFGSLDEGRVHAMRAHRIADGFLSLLAKGYMLSFWFARDNRTVPYNPHGYTTGTMYADTSLSINVAERFSDHLAGYAPVLGVKTASDILASAWVMFNTIRENTQRGGYLKITVPQSLTGKSTNVLQ